MLTRRLLTPFTRLWTRLRRCRLDEELARGADPEASPVLALRASQLASHAVRRRLARGLVKELENALEPLRFSLRLRPHRAETRANADDLLALAWRLDDGRPAEVTGLAQASLLLTRGASPWDVDRQVGLRRAVRSARNALDPTTSPPKLVVRPRSDEAAAA